MLAVLLVVVMVYLASSLIKKDTGTSHITELIRKTLPYSGLNEIFKALPFSFELNSIG